MKRERESPIGRKLSIKCILFSAARVACKTLFAITTTFVRSLLHTLVSPLSCRHIKGKKEMLIESFFLFRVMIFRVRISEKNGKRLSFHSFFFRVHFLKRFLNENAVAYECIFSLPWKRRRGLKRVYV